ncbi:putative phosphodiesterase [Symbiobacterium terraclitae]|uniref:Phosphodiesterase n=1 Tax=Symbiobacterium terraclitae TaxID=557451 RepID=A0ABS4JTB9_9FIRM|nr:putative phosphodiesterase [Symbiobacterium terraclitae]
MLAVRIAIISDVHGNLAALEAVLAEIAAESPDEVVCLGDLAFKGPQPAECVARIRETGIPCIHGNTDLALLMAAGRTPASPLPAGFQLPDPVPPGLAWPVARLSSADLGYLAGLPFDHRVEADGVTVRFVHASPQDAFTGIVPTMAPDKIRPLLQGEQADWIISGHVHQAYAFRFEGRWLANPGAVGFSLDGDGRAAYAVLDTARSRFELRRVAYDVEAAVAAARERDFCFDPDRYGAALRAGFWPADL